MPVLETIKTYGALFINIILERFIGAIVILFIGFIVGRLVGRILTKVLKEVELNKIVKKAGIEKNIERLATKTVSYLIYFIAIIMVLNQIGITTTVLNIVFGAVIIFIIISILLAVKDFIPNLFAGLYIYQKKTIKIGDTIKVKGVEGKVIDINLIETKIQTKKKDTVHIPNSILTKEQVLLEK